jgi:MOSC domain-containing protein YiiM
MLRKIFENIKENPDLVESIIQDGQVKPEDTIRALPKEYIEDTAFLENNFSKKLIEGAQKEIKNLQSKVSKIVREIEKYGSGKL